MKSDKLYIFSQSDFVTSAYLPDDLAALNWADSIIDKSTESRKQKVFLVRFAAPARQYWKLAKEIDWNLIVIRSDIDVAVFAIIDHEWTKKSCAARAGSHAAL